LSSFELWGSEILDLAENERAELEDEVLEVLVCMGEAIGYEEEKLG
jgi:hypothetical protein